MKRIILFMITLVFIFTSLLAGCTSDKIADLHESSKGRNKELQSELIQYMDEHSKLLLKETGFLSRPVITKDKAVGYKTINVNSNIYTKSNEVEASLPYSAGEICSTVEDLYRWENALFSEKLINKESLNIMFTPNLNGYGYGWYISKNKQGNEIAQHTGSIPGYTSLIGKNINKKYSIILLSNINDKEKYEAFYSMYNKLSQISIYA